MSSTFIGIDPGASGALAIINGDAVSVVDLPMFEIKVGKTMRKRLNIAALYEDLLLRVGRSASCYVVLEHLQPQPAFGGSTNYWLGFSSGAIEAVLTCLQLPYQTVRPQDWKKPFGIVKDDRSKSNARQIATRLFPLMASRLSRVKDDGRAESLLLALYGQRTYAPSSAIEDPSDLFSSTSTAKQAMSGI